MQTQIQIQLKMDIKIQLQSKIQNTNTCKLYIAASRPHKPYKSRQIRGAELFPWKRRRNRPTSCLMGMTLVFHTLAFLCPQRGGKKADYACLENMKSVSFFLPQCFGISLVGAEITERRDVFPCFPLFNRSTNICRKFSV